MPPLTRADLFGLNAPVLLPGDAGYEAELQTFNTLVRHRPQWVVVAREEQHVVEAVRFARRRALQVSVQATGHGAYGPVRSGVLVSTRALNAVEVDPVAQRAQVGGGARWGPLVQEAARHSLAPVTGSSTQVGIAGYLLGGGLGPLARSHGFSSDYLEAARVVTGEGEVLEVSRDQNPELFWALRGGKYGLGVVTQLRLRLVPLPSLYAGALLYDTPDIEAALRAWVEWTATAPAQVTTSVAAIRFPPLEVLPGHLRGKHLLALRFAYPGASVEGARLAAPLRDAAPVYVDALGPMPLSDVARIHDDPTEPAPAWVGAAMLSRVDAAFATQLLSQVGAGVESPWTVVEVRHLGGATARDVEEGSAVGGRGAGFALGYIATDPGLFRLEVPLAAGRLKDALRPWLSAERNVNFSEPPKSLEGFEQLWPAQTSMRLQEVRRRYDPRGLFAWAPFESA